MSWMGRKRAARAISISDFMRLLRSTGGRGGCVHLTRFRTRFATGRLSGARPHETQSVGRVSRSARAISRTSSSASRVPACRRRRDARISRPVPGEDPQRARAEGGGTRATRERQQRLRGHGVEAVQHLERVLEQVRLRAAREDLEGRVPYRRFAALRHVPELVPRRGIFLVARRAGLPRPCRNDGAVHGHGLEPVRATRRRDRPRGGRAGAGERLPPPSTPRRRRTPGVPPSSAGSPASRTTATSATRPISSRTSRRGTSVASTESRSWPTVTDQAARRLILGGRADRREGDEQAARQSRESPS